MLLCDDDDDDDECDDNTKKNIRSDQRLKLVGFEFNFAYKKYAYIYLQLFGQIYRKLNRLTPSVSPFLTKNSTTTKII